MMNLPAFFLATMVLGAPVEVQEPQKKPVVEVPIKGDTFDTPNSMTEWIAKCDAVVVATVMEKDSTAGNQAARPRTRYKFKLLRIVKNHSEVQDIIAVFRPGGTKEESNRIVRTVEVGFPDFVSGQTYLMFLSWHERTQGFWLRYSVDSALLVEAGGKLKALGGRAKHPVAQRLVALREKEAIQLLVSESGAR